jgi:DNA-binding beta-propeller fold protein YncE
MVEADNIFHSKKGPVVKNFIWSSMNKKDKIIWLALLALAVCLGWSGCFKHAVEVREPLPDIVWPRAPEMPRISFQNSVSQPAHLQINPGILTKFYHYIKGETEETIVSPYGVSADADGRLYVVDTYLNAVHVFDPEGNQYFSFPENRTSLKSPIGIAIDHRSGVIYLSDSKQAVIKVYKDRGNQSAGEFGGDTLKRPAGIAINETSSELLVVDSLQSTVFRYDLSSRMLKGSFGGDGEEDGRFHYPTNLAVTPKGEIIVSDSLNFRVQVFSSGGQFLMKLGAMGQSPGCFSRPKGVAADSDGNIYVVDALYDNVQVFDSSGQLLMAFGSHGNGYGEFWLPTGIYIDQNDVIYVSDSYNKRVQIFKYLKDNLLLK